MAWSHSDLSNWSNCNKVQFSRVRASQWIKTQSIIIGCVCKYFGGILAPHCLSLLSQMCTKQPLHSCTDRLVPPPHSLVQQPLILASSRVTMKAGLLRRNGLRCVTLRPEVVRIKNDADAKSRYSSVASPSYMPGRNVTQRTRHYVSL